MAKRERPAESPWGILIIGMILGGVGWTAVVVGGEDAAPLIVLAWIGSVLAGVGMVGAGVTMGVRRADELRSRR